MRNKKYLSRMDRVVKEEQPVKPPSAIHTLGVARLRVENGGILQVYVPNMPAINLWGTYLIREDGYPLATHISTRRPSFFSYLAVFVSCALQRGKLPSTVVTNDLDRFHTEFFENFLGELGIVLISEPNREELEEHRDLSCGCGGYDN